MLFNRSLTPEFQRRIAPLLISLTLFVSVLIIAATPPATGYELSIYEAYPAYLWIFLAINIFFSIYSIIRSCNSPSEISYYGYFSILLIETIIIFLPIIRGYYSINRGSGDMYVHMFTAGQILNSGYLPLEDMYPVMHIWLSVLHYFLPNFIMLIFVLSLVFFMFYILSLYILGRTLLGTKTGGVFVSIFGFPLLFSYGHYSFYPFIFALFIIPLILYAHQKITQDPKQKNRLFICMTFLSFFIVFCHPMVTVFLVVIFSLFALYELLKRGVIRSWLSITVAVYIVVLVSVTFLFWIFQYMTLQYTVHSIVSAILGSESHTSILEYQMDIVSSSKASIWLVADHFIKIYGPAFLYFSISLLCLLYLMYHYYRSRKIHEEDLLYSLQFCVAICIGIALLSGYFVIFEPIRAAGFGLIFATILCGLFFYRIWSHPLSEKRQRVLITSTTVIITLVCMLSILALYDSPWVGAPNTALTFGEKSGNDWLLKYRNAEIPIVKEELSNYRYAKYYYFETTKSENFPNLIGDERVWSSYTMIIPSHFGYNINQTAGDSFAYLPENNVYMITTELMKVTQNAVMVERRNLFKSFTDSDSNHLKYDPTVNSVYSGNKFVVWNIAIP